MKNPNEKPDGGRKAPAKQMSEPANRKGGKPAADGVAIQKKVQAYKSIPKAKRIDASYGERKARGTGQRMNVKARTSRQRSKS
jgi:hypothetical protein